MLTVILGGKFRYSLWCQRWTVVKVFTCKIPDCGDTQQFIHLDVIVVRVTVTFRFKRLVRFIWSLHFTANATTKKLRSSRCLLFLPDGYHLCRERHSDIIPQTREQWQCMLNRLFATTTERLERRAVFKLIFHKRSCTFPKFFGLGTCRTRLRTKMKLH